MAQANSLNSETSSNRNETRTNPIPIPRQESLTYYTSDDDDDDDNNDFVGPKSLPSRLLRAPRLASVPNAELDYTDLLPPPVENHSMTQSESNLSSAITEPGVSYGSLRDSQMRGKFMDGPSSYRDRRTGQLHQLRQRIRFQGNNQVSGPNSLSIGERIQKKRAEQKNKQNTSGLAAIMNKKPTATENRQDQAPTNTFSTRTFYDEEQSSQYNSEHMMSTSLTGLELLQGAQPVHHGRPLLDTLNELPRDANGNNALLSRSLSDPTGGRSASNSTALRLLTSAANSPRVSSMPTPYTNVRESPFERSQDDEMDIDAPFKMDL